jgi:hypothetical protein
LDGRGVDADADPEGEVVVGGWSTMPRDDVHDDAAAPRSEMGGEGARREDRDAFTRDGVVVDVRSSDVPRSSRVERGGTVESGDERWVGGEALVWQERVKNTEIRFSDIRTLPLAMLWEREKNQLTSPIRRHHR